MLAVRATALIPMDWAVLVAQPTIPEDVSPWITSLGWFGLAAWVVISITRNPEKYVNALVKGVNAYRAHRVAREGKGAYVSGDEVRQFGDYIGSGADDAIAALEQRVKNLERPPVPIAARLVVRRVDDGPEERRIVMLNESEDRSVTAEIRLVQVGLVKIPPLRLTEDEQIELPPAAQLVVRLEAPLEPADEYTLVISVVGEKYEHKKTLICRRTELIEFSVGGDVTDDSDVHSLPAPPKELPGGD